LRLLWQGRLEVDRGFGNRWLREALRPELRSTPHRINQEKNRWHSEGCQCYAKADGKAVCR
jgi:hypothetical protein